MELLHSASTPFGKSLDLNSFPVLDPEALEMNDNLLVAFKSRDRRSRSFSLMRTALSKRLTQRRARLIGVTSATPGAGKTFLSINLAASLSRVSDGPVYLVDLDLRIASLKKALGLEMEGGVERVLMGEDVPLQSLGYRIKGSNLVVFPTNRVEEGSAELVSGSTYREFIAALRARTGDAVILVDLPPAFAGDDTMISLDELDGYIFVADAGKTTRRQVRDCIRLLDPSPCLGTVLNRYEGGLAAGYGYGSYNYNAYYD